VGMDDKSERDFTQFCSPSWRSRTLGDNLE
jgi:hypothetical protein